MSAEKKKPLYEESVFGLIQRAAEFIGKLSFLRGLNSTIESWQRRLLKYLRLVNV